MNVFIASKRKRVRLLHTASALLLAAGSVLCAPRPVLAQANALGSPLYHLRMYEHTRDFNEGGGSGIRVVDPNTYVPEGLFEPFYDGAVLRPDELQLRHPLGRSIFGHETYIELFATNQGKTFWAEALSPTRGGPARDVVGGQGDIGIYQTYIKQTDEARLTYSFNGGALELWNYGASNVGQLEAAVAFEVRVERLVPGGLPETLWFDYQVASMTLDYNDPADKDDDRFKAEVYRVPGVTATGPLWPWVCVSCDVGRGYGEAFTLLERIYTQPIDLSSLEVNEEFQVVFELRAKAVDLMQGETFARAFARDPVSSSGLGFELEGLLPTNRPTVSAPIPEPATWTIVAAGLGILAAAAGFRRRR